MRKRRIVFKNLRYRLVALALILAGILGVRYFVASDTTTTCFVVKVAPWPETEIGDRDISLYEFGGSLENCAWIETEGDAADANVCWKTRENARAFILDHFKGHRRGYVIVDTVHWYSSTPTYFFIEPDVAGNWEIHMREESIQKYRLGPNIITTYFTEAFRRTLSRTLKDDDGFIKAGTSVLVLRSRGVYELIL